MGIVERKESVMVAEIYHLETKAPLEVGLESDDHSDKFKEFFFQ